MITEFHAKEYGPLKDVSCKLTPLHAFIGPNDSGKSTLLRAITSVLETLNAAEMTTTPPVFRVQFAGGSRASKNAGGGIQFLPSGTISSWIRNGARICRFDADALRKSSSLIHEQDALDFIKNRGLGLPGVLDLLNNRADDALRAISSGMTALFPALARIQLQNISNSEKQAAAQLTDGTRIDAHSMSEGILYYLAYACVRALGGGALLAVEEPENGLHPARIAQVVQILREISTSGTQVIIATHSPLVVNELQPGEVSVVTRTAEAGTQVKPIADTPNFAKRSSVYALGELWLSYANGVDEGPLLNGTAREIPER